MRERGITDQKTGEEWSFVLLHPKSDEAVLVLQPPEGFNVKDFPPGVRGERRQGLPGRRGSAVDRREPCPR